jgi:hypothetical protein
MVVVVGLDVPPSAGLAVVELPEPPVVGTGHSGLQVGSGHERGGFGPKRVASQSFAAAYCR